MRVKIYKCLALSPSLSLSLSLFLSRVSVAGINMAGLGESADQTVTTISLSESIYFFCICEHIRINECYQVKKLLSGYRINESGPVICLILVYTEQPQTVLEPVSVSMETNISANVSWEVT